MREKHKKELRLDEQAVKWLREQAGIFKANEAFRWCEACGVPVSNKDEDWAAHCRDRHEGSRHGWCWLCKSDFNGTREDHLKKEHKNAVLYCKGCRRYVLPGLSKWHSMHHVCYCIQCERYVPFDHIFVIHGCTSACKPTVDYGEYIWIFNHDEKCDNRHWWKCEAVNCKAKGFGDDAFKDHIVKDHRCSEKCECRLEGPRFKIYHEGCFFDEKIWVNCPFETCDFSGTRARVLRHIYGLDHGCLRGECTYRNDQFEHDAWCKWKIWKCPFRLTVFPIGKEIKEGGKKPEYTWQCFFEGTRDQVNAHIADVHGCLKGYCSLDGEGLLLHACTCLKRVFVCPFRVDDGSKVLCVTKEHLETHGCSSLCHVNQNDDGIDHYWRCRNRNFPLSKAAVSKMRFLFRNGK